MCTFLIQQVLTNQMCCICVVIASKLLLFRKREAQFPKLQSGGKSAILNIKKSLHAEVMYIFPVAEGMLHVTTAGYETTVAAQSPIRHHSSSDIGYQNKHLSCTICTGNKH
jgi:hypothetical protein